jgi:chromosome segregation ATPase
MSEINEATMREFFQSLIDKVAVLSTQADRVNYLEQQIQNLTAKVVELEGQNAELRRDLSGTVGHVNELQEKLNATQNALDSERSVSHGLRETIVSRDTKVNELSTDLNHTNEHVEVVTRERDEARNEAGDLRALVDTVRSSLRDTSEDRDRWRNEAQRLEGVVSDLQTRLDRVNSILNPPRPVEPVSSVA